MMFSAFLLCALASAASPEKVVFLGDSITESGQYLTHLQLFSALRHPGKGVECYNVGKSGGTSDGGLRRWPAQGKVLEPDRAFVMFGMNDSRRDTLLTAAPTNEADAVRRAGIVSDYRRNMDALLDLVRKDCRDVIVMTPTPYDQYGPQKCAPFLGGNEPMLTDFAQIVRDLAATKGLKTVELHRTMTELLKKHPEAGLVGGDRVHPTDAGHYLMACLMMSETGADGIVDETLVDADGRSSLSFDYTPKALPFPVTDAYRKVEKVWPVTERLNREMLKVANLPLGGYVLKMDGRIVGRFDREQLEKGVNLALLDTPNSRVANEAEKVRAHLCRIVSDFRSVVYLVQWMQDEKVSFDDSEGQKAFFARQREKAKTLSWGGWHGHCVEKLEKMIPKWKELHDEEERLRERLRSVRPVRTRIGLERDVAQSCLRDGKPLFNRRLGMFVHWGIYSVGGFHEQDMWMKDKTRPEYEEYMKGFTAEKFDADRFVDVAESAGATYIVITSKHHDGFCMWDTKTTDYCAPRSPAKRDLIGELAEACHRRGIGLGFYYSNPDWHCPFSHNPKSTHQLKLQPGDEPDLERYVQYEKDQIRELLTKYGKICCWFWDIPTGMKRPEMDELVRSLQPGILINDRGWERGYRQGGDYSTPERDFNGGGAFTNLIEACNSVGKQSWGYRANEDYHTVGSLAKGIDGFLACGGNYLLNVGPKADGTIPDEAVKRMASVGKWFGRVRESFENVESMPRLKKEIRNSLFKWVKDHDETVPYLLTRRGDVLYVHFPNGLTETGADLAPLNVVPDRAVVLNTGTELKCAVEMLPCNRFHFDKPSLHVWGIPADELANECVVLKLEFAPGALACGAGK